MDKEFKIFKFIVSFVKELDEIVDKNQRSLSLYSRILEKTTISHEKIIKKHISVFETFCTKNNTAILEKDINKITDPVIFYSDKISINISNIFKKVDKETQNTIWDHLLVISSLIKPDPSSKKLLLKSLEEPKIKLDGLGDKEEQFLNKIISKIESSNIDLEDSTDPSKIITSVLSSGVLPEIISDISSGISDGSLDIGKLTSSLMSMNGISGGGMPGGSGGMDILSCLMNNKNLLPKVD